MEGGAIENACRLEGRVPSIPRVKAGITRGLTRVVGREAELEQLRRAHEITHRTGLTGAYIAVARMGNLIGQLTNAVSAFTWVMAALGEGAESTTRIEEAQGPLEKQAAKGIANLYWRYDTLAARVSCLVEQQRAVPLPTVLLRCRRHSQVLQPTSLSCSGDIARQSDPSDAARTESIYKQALALAEPRGMRPLVVTCNHALSARRT